MILAGVWIVAFVVSFFSNSSYVFSSVWTHGIDWILAIGRADRWAVFLLVLRRLSPTGIRRVGSLGIDQFASVAFSVAAVVWLQMLWLQVAVVIAGGGVRSQTGIAVVSVPWVTTWVPWVELVLMLAGVVLTVFAPFIPGLSDDFRHRPETVSHRSARLARPVAPRPKPVLSPVPAHAFAPERTAPAAAAPAEAAQATVAPQATTPAEADDASATPSAVDAAAAGDDVPAGGGMSKEAASDQDATSAVPAASRQAFWALVPEERDVVDENGTALFRIGPTAWALVIEDRGSSYVVRHEDGRVGLLNDVSGVTRG